MKGKVASEKKLRVLLVENHPDTLECLTFYLEDLGHIVLTATCLAEAMKVLPDSQCDVLISDIGLPDGTGWDLLEKTTLPHPIFAVAMSGFGSKSDHSRSLSAGYRHHLLKPLTPSQLDQVLAEAIETRRPSPPAT